MKSRLLFLSLSVLLMGVCEVSAQPTYSYTSTPTVGNVFPFNNAGNNKRQWIYYPSDFPGAPSGTVTTLYFRSSSSASASFTNLEIKMGHSTLTTFTTGPWVTGLTTVYNGPATVSNVTGNWMMVTLTTPFPYNSTQNLIVEASQTGYSPGFTVMQVSSGVTDRTLYGSTTSSTGTTQPRLAEFGFDLVTVCSSPPSPGSAMSLPNPACQGNNITLDLTGHSIGTGQTYQWQEAASVSGPYANLGASSSTSAYTFTPSSAMYYRCILTCSGISDTSSAVQVPVATPLTPSVSIVNDTNNFCQGTPVNFTATPVNGGLNPDYEWKRNGIMVGTNSPTYNVSSLNNNDTITCEMTSSEACVTAAMAVSNKIGMMVITKLPTSVTFTADPSTEICEGDNVTFTATPTNGGTAPTYQWKKNAANVGTNSPVYTDDSLKNNDVVRCEMSSSEGCVTQATTAYTILMKVNPLPDKPFITFVDNFLTVAVIASHYQWLRNGNTLPGDTMQTLTAIDSGWYSVTITDDKGCSITSNPVFNWGVVGVDELTSNQGLSVFPTPFEHKLVVELEGEFTSSQIEVRNITGQLVHQSRATGSRTTLDLSSLDSGVYLLSARWKNKIATVRIVKQ